MKFRKIIAQAIALIGVPLLCFGGFGQVLQHFLYNDGTTTTFLSPVGDYFRIGNTGTSTHALDSENDLLVTGDLEVDGTLFSDGQVLSASSNANTPSYSFIGDENTGFSGGLGDTINISTGGVFRYSINSSSLTIGSGSVAPGADSNLLSFSGNTSAGSRDISLRNEADAGTDTYRLRFNNQSGSQILALESTGELIANQATIARSGVPLNVQNRSDLASNQVAIFSSGNRVIPSDDDNGYLSFTGQNTSGAQYEIGRIGWQSSDVSVGTQDSRMVFYANHGNTLKEFLQFGSSAIGKGEIIVNNSNEDFDLTVHGDTTNDLFVTDASTERVSVGLVAATPQGKFHVAQPSTTAAIPVLVLDQADVSEGLINFIASDRGIIATSITDSVASLRIELNGVVYRIALFPDG